MEPQDELLALIRQLVGQRVQPPHQEQFVRIVAVTVAQLMANPHFVGQLAVFQQLQHQIARLTNENLLLKQVLSDQGQRRPPVPRKKAPAPRKRAAPKSQAKAFNQGVRDVRSGRYTGK